MAVVVEGYSDDLIEVDGDVSEEFQHYGNSEDEGTKYLGFSNGVVLGIRFTNEGDGIWRITPVKADPSLTIEQAPLDGDRYSDKATIDADIAWVVCGVLARADQ